MIETKDQVREVVRHKYAEIAKGRSGGHAESCCGSAQTDAADFSMIGVIIR